GRPGGEVPDAASDGRQAILLIGSTRGPIEKAERLSVASGAPTTHALPAFPMPLSAARVAVRSDAVYVAGTDANGMPRLLAIDPGAADPKWTTHAGWRPVGGELTSLVSQTSAVFATLRNDAGQGDRMLRWTSGEGWSERQALQGTVIQGAARAIGQAHVLYLLRGTERATLATYHTITGSWAMLAEPAGAGARSATAWGNGLAWA